MEPKEGTFEVTPEMANFWLTNYNYDHQRKIRQWHVQNLASEITFGRFLPKTQINFCSDEDHFYLTNGQHTLSAIVLSNEPVILNVVINPVKSFADIADIYARHDTHLTRQLSDSLVAHNIDKKLDVGKDLLSKIVSGIFYYNIMAGDIVYCNKSRVTNDEKLRMILLHGEGIVGMIKSLGIQHKKEGLKSLRHRKTTLGPLYFIYTFQPEKLIEFASTMFEDDGLKKNDPRKALLEFLKECGTSGHLRKFAIRAPDHIITKNFALAWNAFYKRKPLTYLRPKHEDREVYFEGCGMAKV